MVEDLDAVEVCCETVVACVEPEVCDCMVCGLVFVIVQMYCTPYFISGNVVFLTGTCFYHSKRFERPCILLCLTELLSYFIVY
jgi:hypothetical protein